MRFVDFRFTTAFFVDQKTGQGFTAHIEEDDRFYGYLMPFLLKGKVEGRTSLKVDSLCIPKSVYSDIKGKTFQMIAEAIFREKIGADAFNGIVGTVSIDKVCIENIDLRKVEDNGDQIKIKLCDLVIPYKTEIHYYIVEETEEE